MNNEEILRSAHELHLSGDLPQAEILYRKILDMQPDNISVYNDLGNLMQEKGQLNEAISCYQKAIEINPQFAPAHVNLGDVLREKGLPDEAIHCYQKAVQLNPDFIAAYYNMGAIFQDKGQLDEALELYQKVVELNPDDAHTYNTIGVVLQKKGQLDDALKYYQKALRLNPQLEVAYNNIGIVMREKGQIDEALKYYDKALQLSPYCAEIHYGLSLILLLSGNFETGWKEHEWRLLTKEISPFYSRFAQPLWDGSDIQGHTVLLHSEQGLGDTIQFIRYAPLVAQKGARVVVECQKELVPLLKSVEGVDKVIGEDEQLPDFDVHCPLLSLPSIFKTTLENMPASIPYFSVDSSQLRKWQDKVLHPDGNIRIGLAWAGNPLSKRDRFRSSSLNIFSPLAGIEHIVFYSLQKGSPAAQVKHPLKGMKITDFMNEVHDFSDTAALIKNLDLVISVDTAVAHLSGALGKPVWTLIPFSPDWRWMLHREDTPWYPSMRLFRQTAPGDWKTVVERIRRELENL